MFTNGKREILLNPFSVLRISKIQSIFSEFIPKHLFVRLSESILRLDWAVVDV